MAARVLVPERDWEGKQSGIVRQAQGVAWHLRDVIK